MTIEKCGNDVGLVAVGVDMILLANKIAKHGFGDFRIGLVVESAAQHGGRNCHIEQAQPAAHGAESFADVGFAVKGNCFEAGGNGYFTFDRVLQELLVEALDGGQNGKFPFRIFSQRFVSPSARSRSR